MSKEISLFSGYSQKENLVTNYTGLLFKMIYEEDPELFEEFIQKIFPEIEIGPRFNQQVKSGKSVFDLVINQDPFAIVVETKLTDWFYDSQLTCHLEGIKNSYPHEKVYLLLLSNFSYDEELKFNVRFPVATEIAKKNSIVMQQISFESLGSMLLELNLSPMLSRFVKEYNEFLEQKDLLSTWKKLMKSYATGDTFELNKKYQMYYNPKYKTQIFQYLGLYKEKNIQEIGKVIKIVDVNLVDSETNQYEYEVIFPSKKSKVTQDEERRLIGIVKDAKEIGHSIENDHRFYIVEKFVSTNFRKKSSGGLISSKIFNLEELLKIKIEDLTLENIAEELSKLEWS